MSTESNESYLVGDGPELFEIRTVRIENVQVIDPYGGEPLEAPRFLLNGLPEHLRDAVYCEGGERPMRHIIDAGIERLNWRQAPRHIEDNLISEDVFAALKELAPGSVSSLGTISLGWWNDRMYHAFRFHGFPEDDLLGELDDRERIVLSESEPPITPNEPDSLRDCVYDAYSESRKAGLPPLVIALASWMARDDKIIYPGKRSPSVTEGFVQRWRETDISKMLWADNYEHDFFFRPWTYTDRYNGGVPYKWVDAPN